MKKLILLIAVTASLSSFAGKASAYERINDCFQDWKEINREGILLGNYGLNNSSEGRSVIRRMYLKQKRCQEMAVEYRKLYGEIKEGGK